MESCEVAISYTWTHSWSNKLTSFVMSRMHSWFAFYLSTCHSCRVIYVIDGEKTKLKVTNIGGGKLYLKTVGEKISLLRAQKGAQRQQDLNFQNRQTVGQSHSCKTTRGWKYRTGMEKTTLGGNKSVCANNAPEDYFHVDSMNCPMLPESSPANLQLGPTESPPLPPPLKTIVPIHFTEVSITGFPPRLSHTCLTL